MTPSKYVLPLLIYIAVMVSLSPIIVPILEQIWH